MAGPPPPSTLNDDLRFCGTVVLILLVACILMANVAVTVQSSPLLTITLLTRSVMVAAVGIYAGRMPRRELAAPMLYLLQICPLLIVGSFGLLALFLRHP